MTEASLLVIQIIERASTLRERQAGDFVPIAPASLPRVEELLDDWCRTAARGDAEYFDRRLALDGLDRARARAALRPVLLTRRTGIPEWAGLLERYLDSLARSRSGTPAPEMSAEPRLAPAGDVAPFSELFTGLADLTEEELAPRAGAALAAVAPPARAALRSSLLDRLTRVAAPLLYERFDDYRSSRRTATRRDGPGIESDVDPSRRIYADFVHDMLGGGILELFREYPVLARLIATVALQWRDATAEFLRRLESDRESIAERFTRGGVLGDLTALRPGLSDPHQGGRTVHRLTFACGLRLVYKPRSLGIDAAFGELLHWLTARGAPLAATASSSLAPHVLDRGEHGWCEYLERRECRDRAAVRRYYQYAGALLCLLHALGSTDCHHENILAAGDVSVPIDLETVLQPEIARAEPPVDHARNIGARRLHDDSVLRTGMLPIWQAGAGGATYDIGGLSACAGQATPFAAARWVHVNTDAMRLEHRRAVIGEHPNMPLLGGTTVPPVDHVDDIVLGFTRMYEWLESHSESLLAPDGPLVRLARERVRFIARPSSVYDHVLRRSLRSEALRDGGTRSVSLELLARGLLPLSSVLWPLLRVEQRALEQLDIPILTVRGDGTSIALDHRDGSVDGATLPVARSGLEVARSRIAALSADDLSFQAQVIRSSFALRYAGDPHAAEEAAMLVRTPHEKSEPEACAGSELLAAARDIADAIQRTALADAAGHPTWITIEPISASGRSRLHATGYGLYDGLGGIALFLAAAARCCGDAGYASLASRALVPLRERLHASRPDFVEEYGIGGACGAASAIYALLRTGMLLDDESLMRDALHVAEQITSAAIVADRHHDVLYGAAGAILALLALERVYPGRWLLERALLCGSHLIEHRCPTAVSSGSRHQARRTASGRMLPGFAHGAAGIAYALFRLHAATGCAELHDAARDAMLYEDELLDAGLVELPDRGSASRAGSGGGVGSSWCRGTAGIGLARVGSLVVVDAPYLRRGLGRAIVASDPAGSTFPSPLDNLCCGSFGTVELLLATGLARHDPALVTAARTRAAAIVRRRRASGAYRLLSSRVDGVYDPALYRGTAGIGYGLLRLCYPEVLPSLLLWE